MKKKVLILSLAFVCLITVQSCCIKSCLQYEHDEIGRNSCLSECKWDVFFVWIKALIVGDPSWEDPLGFQTGIGVPVWFINEQLSVRSGGFISLQGAGWEEGDLKGKVSLWYGYVPLTLRYKHSSGFYGEAGLQPGFLLSAKDKYEGMNENYMDYMNRFDLSIPISVGYKFKNNLGVNLKVAPGINDITKEGNLKDRNFVMGLGLSYYFNLKK